jgi:hypothetical protein
MYAERHHVAVHMVTIPRELRNRPGVSIPRTPNPHTVQQYVPESILLVYIGNATEALAMALSAEGMEKTSGENKASWASGT